MNILVTGSLGFVGKHLTPRLKALGHKVLGVDKKVDTSTVNIQNVHKLASAYFSGRVDMIVHLGANCSTAASLERPGEDFTDNVIGTFNAVSLAREFACPILYTSSCKVIPGDDGARAPYGLSKLVGEMYIEEFHMDYGVPYIINRMGGIYGPGQEGSAESGWVAWFIKAMLEDREITVFGDGNQVRDILFIDDLIELLVFQIENFRVYQNATYDIGGGEENAISINQMLKSILRYTKYHYDAPRKSDASRFVSENTFSNWKPKTPIEVGIQATIDYYLQKKEGGDSV